MSKKPLDDLQSMFKDLYDPGFKPKDIDFQHFYNVAEKQAKEDVDRAYSQIRELADDHPRDLGSLAGDAALKKPLTKEEALLVEAKKDQIYDRANNLRNALEGEIGKIDEEAVGWAHTFDLGPRPRLKKAIKRIFGGKKETITYAEFKSLLIRKKQLEMSEAADIMKDDEEDTNNDKGSGLDFIKDIINVEVK
jgi:hypothetical protein